MSGKNPLGDRLRKIFEDARNDPKRTGIQLEIMNSCFDGLAKNLSFIIEKMTNDVDKLPQEARNTGVIIKSLQGEIKPRIPIPLPIDTTLTDFTAEQICDLPSYIRLHETARRLNVALKLVGVIKEPYGDDDIQRPCALIVDVSKEYEQGRDNLYPVLPPLPPSLGRKPGSYDLGS